MWEGIEYAKHIYPRSLILTLGVYMFFKEEPKSNDLITGMLIGAAVGAVAGILLAPKGQDIVHDIADGTSSLLKKAKSCLKHDHADEHSPYYLGNILGALLNGASKVILSPKSSKVVREYISESYQNVSDRTWQLINNLNAKGEEIAELVKNQSSAWTERSFEVAETVTEEVHEWAEALRNAALEAKLKAEKHGKDPAYQNKIVEVLSWSQKALDIADEVTYEVKNWKETIQSALKNSCNQAQCFEQNGHHKNYDRSEGTDSVSQLVEWATVGFNIWQNLQHNKRR